MKTKPIKILFIEENQLDMELALSELQTSTLSFVYQSVDYKADFKPASNNGRSVNVSYNFV